MATEPKTAEDVERSDCDKVVTLEGVSWADFEAIAAMKGDRHSSRLIYNRGRLTLVSPSYKHERNKDRLDRIVMAVCSELEIAGHPSGATLFQRADLERGIEGDGTYYVAHEREVRRAREIALPQFPPPDLVIEVEYVLPARTALEVWSQLGVPEAWVYNAAVRAFRILHRDLTGNLIEAPQSLAFPFLPVEEIETWINCQRDEADSMWERRLREWVRDELSKRVQ